MLVDFSVENFLSFKDKVTLSMVASRDDSRSPNVIRDAQGTGIDLLKSCVVYGANASGKSNLIESLRAFSIITHFSDQFEFKWNNKIRPFKLNIKTINKPSTFSASFIIDGVLYEYGFSIGPEFVSKEWLKSFPKKQPRLLFNRTRNSKKAKSDYKFGAHWKGGGKSLTQRTREDALFLTVAARFNNDLALEIIGWMTDSTILTSSGFSIDMLLNAFTGPLIHEGEIEKSKIIEFIRHADIQIDDFNISPDFEENTQNSAVTPGMEKKYKITMYHSAAEDGKKVTSVPFDFEQESDGTKKIFSLSALWLFFSQGGNRIFFDELDEKLHPLLTRRLIEMFNNEKNNNGAQLIFTTHDASLLDKSLFRRDQIWFTEMSEDGSSDLFSLWDFKARKDENIMKGYMSGRYGAIPHIDRLFNWRDDAGEKKKNSKSKGSKK